MNIPEDIVYAETHEWMRVDGEIATVGITDHAQNELSDVVFVELPQINREVDRGDSIATIDSVKAASEIYAPVAGTIVEVNDAVKEDPARVNSDPYGEGWLFKIKMVTDDAGIGLMTPQQYREHIT